MDAVEFLKTIYLGDRAVKSITIDGWRSRVMVQVDEISRIRSQTGYWEYYNNENIIDGLLVFTGVESLVFEPPGPIANDYINDLTAEALPGESYSFTLSVGSVDDSGTTTEVIVKIVAKGLYLENRCISGNSDRDLIAPEIGSGSLDGDRQKVTKSCE